VVLNPEDWREIGGEFKVLRTEEVQWDHGNRNDRWLRAYISRKDESSWPVAPEPFIQPSPSVIHVGAESESELMPVSVLTETPKPLLCLAMARQGRLPQDSAECSDELRAFLSDGISERFKADFEALATKAGMKLGSPIIGVAPLQNWLLSLFANLLETKSNLVFAGDRQTGGIIKRVCEASSLFAARLEREALERNAASAVSGNTPMPQADEGTHLCAACKHPYFFHQSKDGFCFASLKRELALARTSNDDHCWCRMFTNDPREAGEEILKHGNEAAIRRGINEAIDRRDVESAQRLRTRLIRETSEADRDGRWLDEVNRSINDLLGSPSRRIQIEALETENANSEIQEEEVPVPANSFVREGETWAIAFNGETCRLPATLIGLEYISALLRRPGATITALELRGVRAAAIPVDPGMLSELRSSLDTDSGGHLQVEWSSQDVFDGKARAEVEHRVKELKELITIAQDTGNTAGANTYGEEVEYLLSELRKQTKKSGRR
jgi:hypothetical protein